MKTFLIYLVIVLAVLGLGYFLFQSSNKPVDPASQPGQAFENQGQEHINQGSIDHVPYNSNPPSSGPHWPEPAAWGVYKTQLADEQLVHNLEHGGIWISYLPSATSPETVGKLEDFARRYKKVIVEPRAANDVNIALSAWMHVQKLDNYDENTIIKFIEAYYDEGPEKVP